MGSSQYSRDAYSHLAAGLRNKSVKQTFTQQPQANMSPVGVDFREARDSDNHPESLAIMVWLDATGSMGEIPRILVSEKLDKIMTTLIDHGIKDPAVFFGAIGDVNCDNYPLQVGQFESGALELVQCLTTTFLEGGGGGNGGESYSLAHYFAGKHTSIDCFEKRQQRGFLFTIGDEPNHKVIAASQLKHVFEIPEALDITDRQALEAAQRLYHVFHIHVAHDSSPNYSSIPIQYWQGLLGERLIIANDYKNIAEIIASTIAVVHGIDLNSIVSGFDSKTAADVKKSLAKVDLSVSKSGQGKGVVTL